MFVNKKVESYMDVDKDKDHLPTLDSQIRGDKPQQ